VVFQLRCDYNSLLLEKVYNQCTVVYIL
jgi:hypothetical protein